MPYEYFCQACDAVSPEQRERRVDAEDDLVTHRRDQHGGLRPTAGDGVRRVQAEAQGDGILSGRWMAALILLALLLANCRGPFG